MYRLIFIVVLFIATLTACGTMQSTPDEIDKATADEGFIAGSFVVTAEETDENKTEARNVFFGNGGFFGPKESKVYTYNFGIKRYDGIIDYLGYGARYNVYGIKINEEFYFVKKLPQGKYTFKEMSSADANLRFPFYQSFEVYPGKAIYLGKLEIKLPQYLTGGVKFTVNRKNNIDEARLVLEKQYPSIAKSMVPQSGFEQ